MNIKRYITFLMLFILVSCSAEKQVEKKPESNTNETEKEPITKAEPTEKKPIKGIDVSHFQGDVNWTEVKSAGFHYAFVKATEGVSYVDTKFNSNWNNLEQAGLIRGAYHFYVSSDDADKQADHFINTVKELKKGDLPPVLDLEPGGMKGTVDKNSYAQNVLVWLDKVEKGLGIKPIIYTDHPFGNEYLSDKKFGSYPLWIAEYGVEQPKIPSAWQPIGWTFWQFKEKGEVQGVNGGTDHDQFNGGMEGLKKLTVQ